MMGIGRKIQFLVMARVIVTEGQPFEGIHILINIHQAINGSFNIHELTKIEDGTIAKIDFTSDEAFITASFVVGHGRSLDQGAGVNDFLKGVEVGLNSQHGSPVKYPPFPEGVLINEIRRSIQ